MTGQGSCIRVKCPICGQILSVPDGMETFHCPVCAKRVYVSEDNLAGSAGPEVPAEEESVETDVSRKHWKTALILAATMGNLGMHRFYCQKYVTGTIWLLTFGLFGIGWLTDVIMILAGRFKDNSGAVLKKRTISFASIL